MYLYETHMHTSQGSKCGHMTGKDHVKYYKDLGYSGIIITDHFYGGNTAPARDLPWRDYVDQYCSGYEEAYNEGLKQGLDVFFGWEQGYTSDDEYLVYGLDKNWLYEHPEIKDCSRARQYELVHKGGGIVIQAHPFRWRGYMKYVRLGLRYCDGIEAVNAGNQPINDLYASNYGIEYSLPMTAGSDNHDSSKEGQSHYGIILEKKANNIHDIIDAIMAKTNSLYYPVSRLTSDMTDQFIPETYWLNENEELVPTGRKWEYPMDKGGAL